MLCFYHTTPTQYGFVSMSFVKLANSNTTGRLLSPKMETVALMAAF